LAMAQKEAIEKVGRKIFVALTVAAVAKKNT
jgi:hypothetical protein